MFKFYPKFEYAVDDYDSLTAIDITKRIKVTEYVKRTSLLSARSYFIQDGELPEHISYKLYSKPTYAYTILLINEIHNIFEEWPRSNKQFIKYIEDKYGSVAASKATSSYWFDGDGVQMSLDYWQTVDDNRKYALSNYAYEEELNNKKKEIRVLLPSIIPRMETAIQEILNSSGN